MKVLIHFDVNEKKKLFEAEQLKRHIIDACEKCNIEHVEKYDKSADIANFISLNTRSALLIRSYVERNVPTLLWMFYANTDADAEIIKTRKNGEKYIPKHRLTIINMMDAIIVPSNEAKLYLWKLKVRIPVFVVRNGVKDDYFTNIEKIGKEPFLRSFRIDENQKYVVSVIRMSKRRERLNLLNKLAKAAPMYNFYVFVSARKSISTKLIVRRLDYKTAKNLIVSPIVPEDVYRAALYGANFFYDTGDDKLGTMSLVEVIAANTAIIIDEEAAFSDILKEGSAYFANRFEDVLYVLTNASDQAKRAERAANYTTKYNSTHFINTVCELFTKIYHR